MNALKWYEIQAVTLVTASAIRLKTHPTTSETLWWDVYRPTDALNIGVYVPHRDAIEEFTK
jgi:hypothetical protein